MRVFPLTLFPADRPAAIDDEGRVLTYGELASISIQLHSEVTTGTVALVLVRNTLGCIAAIVALIEQGVVPIMLDANALKDTVKHYIDRYRPEILVFPKDIQELYESSTLKFNFLDYVMVPLLTLPRLEHVHSDLALLLSTSGSTGSPKLVRQSKCNLLSNAKSIIDYLNIESSDRPIINLPLHYTYGFSILNSHLQVGATVLLTSRSVLDKQFWNFISKEAGTSLAGVPYTYQMLKRLGFLRRQHDTLRTLTQAGGKLNDDLIREFADYANRMGIDFFVMYGQAEATARISYVPSHRAMEKAGSVGIAIPEGEMFLLDFAGNKITSPDVEGQLGYCGDNVAMGYAKSRADLSRGDEWGGILLTGDLARYDDDGYYYITGRLNRVVKIYGKRMNLDDLEQISLDIVSEVACKGTDDLVTIYITESNFASILPRHLAENTGVNVAAYKVQIVDHLPRTPAGKIDYLALSVHEVSS